MPGPVAIGIAGEPSQPHAPTNADALAYWRGRQDQGDRLRGRVSVHAVGCWRERSKCLDSTGAALRDSHPCFRERAAFHDR